MGPILYLLSDLSNIVTTFEPPREKPTMWFPNRSDTNRAVQALKMA